MFTNTPSVYTQTSPKPFPKFPISQNTPAHLAEHYLGNWEIGKWLEVHFPNFPTKQPIWLSTIWEIGTWLQVHTFQFPNFPKDPSPSGLALFGKLGKRYIFPNFPKSPAQMGQHDLGNWEIGKWLEVHISQFPNFPKKTPAQMGQHDLRNWEIGKWLEVHIFQFPNFPKDTSPDGPARFEKLGNGLRYIFPNFPISQKTPAQMGQHDLGNWEIGKWLEVHIFQFPNFPKKTPAQMGQHDLGNWEIGKTVLGLFGWDDDLPETPLGRYWRVPNSRTDLVESPNRHGMLQVGTLNDTQSDSRARKGL